MSPQDTVPTPQGDPVRDSQLERRKINAQELLDALRAASAWLEVNRETVNALNVFPVPDGDTGTNMSLTMRAALDEVGSRVFDSASDLAQVIAHGALMGARGNSGVILADFARIRARRGRADMPNVGRLCQCPH